MRVSSIGAVQLGMHLIVSCIQPFNSYELEDPIGSYLRRKKFIEESLLFRVILETCQHDPDYWKPRFIEILDYIAEHQDTSLRWSSQLHLVEQFEPFKEIWTNFDATSRLIDTWER
jgi:hypothetical protein